MSRQSASFFRMAGFAASAFVSVSVVAQSPLPKPFLFPKTPSPGASGCASCAKSRINREELSFDNYARALLKLKLDTVSPVPNDLLLITAGLPMAFLPGERYSVLPPGPEKGHSPDHLIMHAERRKIIFKTRNVNLGKLSFVSSNFPGYEVRREKDKLVLSSLRRRREYLFESPDGGHTWRIASIRDMDFPARRVDCVYDSNGALTETVLPNGMKYRIEYGNGLPSKVVDPFGAVTTLTWTSGYLTCIETSLTPKHPFYPKAKGRGKPFVVRSIHLQCDSVGRLVNMVNTNGEMYKCEYLKNDDKKKKTSTLRGELRMPDGTVKYCQIRWNMDKTAEYPKVISKGVVVVETDGKRRDVPNDVKFMKKKAKVFSSFKRIRRGRMSKIERDAKSTNAVTAETDAIGRTTSFSYDDRGLRTSIEYSDDSYVSMEYDKSGRLVSRTDEDGRETRYEYDKAGLLRSIDKAGITTNYRYDDKGRPVLSVLPGGLKHKFSWDPLFRMATHRRPDGTLVVYAYSADKVSEITTISSDGKKRSFRKFEYDPTGKLMAVVYPDKTSERFKYNCCDLLETKDRAGAVTKFAYDSQRRKVAEFRPNNIKTKFEYCSLPGLERKIAKILKSDGTWTRFEYDEAGDLTKESRSDGTWVKYKYDSVGNRTVALFSDGTISHYKYDKRNRLVATTGDHQNNTRTSYSPAGLLLKSEDYGLPATLIPRITRYFYDKHGRLVKTALPNGASRISYYDGLSRRLKAMVDKGVVTSYKYDEAGRLAATAKYSVTDVKNGKKGLFNDNIIEMRFYDEFGNLKEVRRSVDVAENNPDSVKIPEASQ